MTNSNSLYICFYQSTKTSQRVYTDQQQFVIISKPKFKAHVEHDKRQQCLPTGGF